LYIKTYTPGIPLEKSTDVRYEKILRPAEACDLLIIHDTGVHGHAMGFNYNAKLRPQVLLLHCDGSVERIRRETEADYFATLDFRAKPLLLRDSKKALQPFGVVAPYTAIYKGEATFHEG
jgi:hypothetical protein